MPLSLDGVSNFSMSCQIPKVFENNDIVIINKPVGIPMHDNAQGIAQILRTQYGFDALHLCHRLDTPTSGCLVLAKNPIAAAKIGELFEQRLIQKYYLALTNSRPKKKQGTIKGDMKNRRKGQHLLLKSMKNPAITQFISFGLDAGVRVAVVKPFTGKTHQIRVAMKSNSTPLIGDTLYSGSQSDRMYLHAYQIGFSYKGEDIVVSCLPEQGDLFLSKPFQQWHQALGDISALPWPTIKSPLPKND